MTASDGDQPVEQGADSRAGSDQPVEEDEDAEAGRYDKYFEYLLDLLGLV